jgi:hypothetical protein
MIVIRRGDHLPDDLRPLRAEPVDHLADRSGHLPDGRSDVARPALRAALRGHVNVDLMPLIAAARAARFVLAIVTMGTSSVIVASCCSTATSTGTLPGSAAGARTRCGASGLWIPYLAMPVGFGLLLLQLVADTLGRGDRHRQTLPGGEALMDPLTSWAPSWPSSPFRAVLRRLGGRRAADRLGWLPDVFDGARSLELMPEILFGKLNNFALLSIPMFIIMGASIASTRAGADLYEALERWLTRCRAGWWSPTLVPARCSPPCRDQRRPRAPPSARWASPRCASAAIRTASRPAPSRRAARWVS